MSYKSQSDPELIADLHRRKEFAQLFVPADNDWRITRDPEAAAALAALAQSNPILSVGELHSHQVFDRNYAGPTSSAKRFHLMHSTGCHAAGTMLMMFDGSTCAVENLIVGDELMGDDRATPRRILALCRGRQMMYEFCPLDRGARYTFNEDHILCLINRGRPVLMRVGQAFYIQNENKRFNATLWELGDAYRALPGPVIERTGFRLRQVGMGDYYGFTLSGNGQFLGWDSLVMHNTGKCLGANVSVMLATSGGRRGDPHCVPAHRVRIGDVLYDDEYRETVVLSTCRGTGPAFSIAYGEPIGGYSMFTCNDAHPLTVYFEEDPSVPVEIEAGRMFRIQESLRDAKMRILITGPGSRIVSSRFVGFRVFSIAPQEYFGFTLSGNGRFLLGDGLITHNTNAAIGIAQEFVNLYRTVYSGTDWRDPNITTPSVFVFGFGGTRSAFFRDLLKDPKFGYISLAEREELERYRRETLSTGDEDSLKRYKEFFTQLKRRITQKSRGGFFKFFGYDEFVNKLFISSGKEIDDVVAAADSGVLPEVAVERAVSAGKLVVNRSILKQFENALIIADEVHETYNAQVKNNRGLAIQYVLDTVPSVRLVSMSATPINNAPEEIAEFINYLVEPGDKVPRDALFENRELREGALDRICSSLAGKVSFLQDLDERHFPRREFIGDQLRNLPYLRFTTCPMSKAHWDTYIAYRTRSKGSDGAASLDADLGSDAPIIADEDDNVVGIAQNAYSLFDMIFPNPSGELGLYDSATTPGALVAAPAAWREKIGIAARRIGNMYQYSGSFLSAGELGHWSAKYAKLVEIIPQIIKATGPCKIMIYHERVRMTGITLVAEVLKANGIIDERSEPVNSTLCAVCGQARSDCLAAGGHEYRPLRFIAVHAELDAATRESYFIKYDSSDNIDGSWCSILLGSRIVRASYDFKGIRHLIVLSLPVSIPALIQVFGRCVRKGSHELLPPEKRNVEIRILVNTEPSAGSGVAEVIAPEVKRYMIKLDRYRVIQQVEREIARCAVDAGINRNIIMSKRILAQYFPEGDNANVPRDMFGLLYYDAPVPFAESPPGGFSKDTFFAYGHGLHEVADCVRIIRRLFALSPIWPYNALVRAIRDPPFGVEKNPHMIDDATIGIALGGLIGAVGAVDGGHTIAAIGNYLVVVPMATAAVAGIVRKKPLIDVEIWRRPFGGRGEIVVSPDALIERMRVESFSKGIVPLLKLKYSGPFELNRHRRILIEVSTDHQKSLATRLVEDKQFRGEFPGLYDLFVGVGIMIMAGAVRPYKDTVKKLAKFPSKDDEPVGHANGHDIRLYDGEVWIEVPRSALNLHMEAKENEIAVGIFEQFAHSVKFKLRRPVHHIRRGLKEQKGAKVDMRTVARGIVCSTQSKAAIIRIARELGIAVGGAGAKKGASAIRAGATSKDICDAIQARLVGSEIAERENDTQYKYIYGWWDRQPRL